MKPYAIQYRINTTYTDGRLERGKWHNWKRYKTLSGLINAWEHYKSEIHVGCVTDSSGATYYRTAWQFRAVNLLEEEPR